MREKGKIAAALLVSGVAALVMTVTSAALTGMAAERLLNLLSRPRQVPQPFRQEIPFDDFEEFFGDYGSQIPGRGYGGF